jgi:hypothetical protein
MVGFDGGLALETERVFCRGDIGKPTASSRACRECGASLQRTTSGDWHVFFHGESSSVILCEVSVRRLAA